MQKKKKHVQKPLGIQNPPPASKHPGSRHMYQGWMPSEYSMANLAAINGIFSPSRSDGPAYHLRARKPIPFKLA
ncbi:MAG: hypothetical protein A2103_01230 [Gammaproteobacteria bacterium GWF2_41_13]|nr:MAG: hypothetical protein A2103_01230 [Gammaproteobacteria bacterium GWF2_41_13]